MIRTLVAVALLFLTTRPLLAQSEAVIESEVAPEKVERPESLGTRGYRPTEREKPFLEKLAKGERRTGSAFEEYTILGKKGTDVSWFGVVRSFKAIDATKDLYELVVEHKYFDGMTDSHILTVSFNGSGDFKVEIRAKKLEIARLSLVRVYGKVEDEVEKVPVLDASYARVFPWKTFTFMAAYGEDRSNKTWRKKNQVELDRIYDPAPDDDYYRDRLGEP